MTLLQKAPTESWHRINTRQAESLLTAEFLHHLYERHSPFVNPIRVSTTMVEFKLGRVSSFTPSREWQVMVRRTRDAFLASPVERCTELQASLDRPRDRTRALLKQLESTDLSGLSSPALVDLLVSTMFIPLGDIFEINLVQVEESLHDALREAIASLMPDASEPDVFGAIAQLVASPQETVLVNEERDFISLVLATLESPADEVNRLLADRLALYAPLTAAYGGTPPTLTELAHRYSQYAGLGRERLREQLAARSAGGAPSMPDWADRDQRIRIIASVLRRLGEVRDSNKALLGKVTVWRSKVVGEIGSRRNVAPQDLAFYSLEELSELCTAGVRVPPPVIALRRDEGVIFRREAHFDILGTSVQPEAQATAPETLHGIPSSAGEYLGRAFVLAGEADITNMRYGDVLVAAGTDFDLGLMLTLAGAVITEEGGLLSHASVVAREKQIPCVLQVKDATAHLITGAFVLVDGNRGLITVVQPAHQASPDRCPAPGRAASESGRLLDLTSAGPLSGGLKAAHLAELALLGFPLPEPLHVLPASQVHEIAVSPPEARRELETAVAREIMSIFGEASITLRSSGVTEDGGTGASAAGIYQSVIDVVPTETAVTAALRKVMSSGSAEVVTKYFGDQAPQRHHLGILVGPYLPCIIQGTALYPSPWFPGTAAVEYTEQIPTAPQRTFRLVEAEPQQPSRTVTVIDGPGIATTYAKRLSEHWGGVHVELEWGVHENTFVVFQGRQVGSLDSQEAV